MKKAESVPLSSRLTGNLAVFWRVLKYFDQREVTLIARVSKSFHAAVYHKECPLWKQLPVFIGTSNYETWRSYILWTIKRTESSQPVSMDISLTLSRVSDPNVTEAQLQKLVLHDLCGLFAAIVADQELKDFKLYLDQHPIRQKVLSGFLLSLSKHANTIEKLRISQVSLKTKHVFLLTKFRHLKYLDIGYCVCENKVPLTMIGEDLNEFHCQDTSNLSAVQLLQIIAHNPHIWSLSFCAEDYKAEDINSVVEKIDPIRKLVITHALAINGKFFKTLAQHADRLEKLVLTKATEVDSIDIGHLLSCPLPQLEILTMAEFEHMNTINVVVLCENCPNLAELNLEWSLNVEDAGVEAILTKLRKLRRLNLTGLKKASGGPFKRALTIPGSALNSLQSLDVSQCNGIKDDVLKEILKRFPHMSIRNYYGETDDFWNS